MTIDNGPRRIAHYEILGEARRDSLGIYYKARHQAMQRLAMLKTLYPSVAADLTMRKRFLRAAQALAASHHPNIIQLYDVGDSDPVIHQAMEWVEGRTLAEEFDGTPWPVAKAVQFVEGVAAGVAAMHRQGLVHRDLNPAVILVTSDGQPKIFSAFWARAIDDPAVTRPRSGVAIGAPDYAAPEQAADSPHPVGAAADVYSLGVILYELLMGRRPLGGAGDAHQRTAGQDAWSRPAPELPAVLEAILAKCMEGDPSERFPDAATFADALRCVLEA